MSTSYPLDWRSFAKFSERTTLPTVMGCSPQLSAPPASELDPALGGPGLFQQTRLKNSTGVDVVPKVRKKLMTDCSVQELTSEVRKTDCRDSTGDGMKAGGRKEPPAIAHSGWYSKSGNPDSLRMGASALVRIFCIVTAKLMPARVWVKGTVQSLKLNAQSPLPLTLTTGLIPKITSGFWPYCDSRIRRMDIDIDQSPRGRRFQGPFLQKRSRESSLMTAGEGRQHGTVHCYTKNEEG
ncbi:hypothetical protein B0H13DRAFT_1901352 [Mycena leptocephala]|nr:hypothetical protein B0H13DRAFT_1901352 [Mycena leptocephala]